MGKGKAFQQVVLEQLDSCAEKSESDPNLTLCTKGNKVDSRPKSTTENYQVLRR